jgi:hypothetical protein
MIAADEIAAEAYVFGYPLVLMDVTRRLSTAVSQATSQRAPMNQFAHLRAYPDDTFTDVVSPNADTLYSVAWLDLASQPVVMSLPDTADRYYVMPILDAWTNVFAPLGTRTTGNIAGDFVVTGPRWAGTIPPKVTRIIAPTNIAWVVGRTLTNGVDDYPNVHKLQDQCRLTPLSAWGRDYRPPTHLAIEPWVDGNTPPVNQVARMSAETFFTRLNRLMIGNPPSASDEAVMGKLATIGISPGRAVETLPIDPALAAGAEAGRARITGAITQRAGSFVNGWDMPAKNTGSYGTDYLLRASVAMGGLGANLSADAVYPRATRDATGEPLTGKRDYVIRFDAGQLPPVSAFWSVTLYNMKQRFVRNPLGRFTLGTRDQLLTGEDGTVSLYVSHQSPGPDKQANWLPAPQDAFNLILRLYWPSRSILDGDWRPPVIQRVS